jgi:hypothetical protein
MLEGCYLLGRMANAGALRVADADPTGVEPSGRRIPCR